MKVVKTLAIVLAVWVGIVVVFETLIGVLQPQAGDSLVITTFDDEGNGGDRVLAHLETDGRDYVAVNHWPRAWYNRALENPDVEIVIDGERSARRAVPVEAAEHDRVQDTHPTGLVFRFLTGFPPRYFLRLDPR